jgi:hypothetical protein
MLKVGTVDAAALFTSEKLSPATPSTFSTAAALVVRFRFEACLTRDMVDMVASSVSSCEIASQACARRNRCQELTLPWSAKKRHERDRHITAFG